MKSRFKQPAEPEQAQFAERLAAALAARGMLASATVLQCACGTQVAHGRSHTCTGSFEELGSGIGGISDLAEIWR